MYVYHIFVYVKLQILIASLQFLYVLGGFVNDYISSSGSYIFEQNFWGETAQDLGQKI